MQGLAEKDLVDKSRFSVLRSGLTGLPETPPGGTWQQKPLETSWMTGGTAGVRKHQDILDVINFRYNFSFRFLFIYLRLLNLVYLLCYSLC